MSGFDEGASAAEPDSLRATKSRTANTEKTDRAAGQQALRLLAGLIEPLGQALPDSHELVLHDLCLLPNSIIAVHGEVTGRRVGDPATDLLLSRAASGDLNYMDHMLGYRTKLADGRSMRSSTMVIRSPAGDAVGALCLNIDISMWQSLERIAAMMTGRLEKEDAEPSEAPAAPHHDDDESDLDVSEVFVRDVDELAAHLLNETIQGRGVPVELMKKEHKLEAVRALQARGFFLLRDAVELVASSLLVTRFTIYNYLKQIEEQEGTAPPLRGTTSESGHTDDEKEIAE